MKLKWVLIGLAVVGGGLLIARASFATLTTTITVDTIIDSITDDGQCSLREAIISANTDAATGGCAAGNGADTIYFASTLPQPAVFNLKLTGVGEDNAMTGDFDITSAITIQGMGQDQIIVDGNAADRIFDVLLGANLTLSGLTVRNGNPGAGAQGSGIRSAGRFTFLDGIVTLNQGNGITNDGGLAVLTNVNVTDNQGYGIYNFKLGSLTYNVGEVSGNQKGGIYNTVATATLTGINVLNNAGAGGIANVGSATSRLTVMNSLVKGNSSSTNGGGINSDGAQNIADIRNTTISSNQASLAGGGVFNFGIMALIGNTIESNNARTGGGVDHFGGQISMSNDTVSGNAVTDNGGGLYNRDSATLVNVTFSGNTASGQDTGGNLFNDTASISIKNTIMANSDTDGNCFNSEGFMNSLGNNLDSGNTCGFTASGDLVNTDPLLGRLQDNGGTTFTLALLAGSPAIDGGTNAGCTKTDQRGYSRPVDGDGNSSAVCDIGAYEVDGLPPTATKTATSTGTATITTTPTDTATLTFMATPSITPTSTLTDTATPTATSTDTPTPLPIDTPTETATATEFPTMTPIPSSPTVGKVTGGGTINLSGKNGKANFGFVVQYFSGDLYPDGNLQYIDHVNDMRLSASSFDLLFIDGNHAIITGTGIIGNGMEFGFTINLYDYGEPGSSDQFMIEIPGLDGYSAGGTISGGNIKIH